MAGPLRKAYSADPIPAPEPTQEWTTLHEIARTTPFPFKVRTRDVGKGLLTIHGTYMSPHGQLFKSTVDKNGCRSELWGADPDWYLVLDASPPTSVTKQTRHNCHCERLTLLRTGCRCGGI